MKLLCSGKEERKTKKRKKHRGEKNRFGFGVVNNWINNLDSEYHLPGYEFCVSLRKCKLYIVFILIV